MILHFLKRDFKSFWLYWIILVISSIIVLSLYDMTAQVFLNLGFAYFILGGAWITRIIQFHSPRTLSRFYLLSLPLRRKTLYICTFFRSLVLHIPYLAIAICFPLFVGKKEFSFEGRFAIHYILFLLEIIFMEIWFIATGIGFNTDEEKKSGRLPQQYRIMEWIRVELVRILEMSIVVFAFSSFFVKIFDYNFTWLVLSTVITGILALARFFIEMKNWLYIR